MAKGVPRKGADGMMESFSLNVEVFGRTIFPHDKARLDV
jgi:hypothetical protein